MVVDLGGAGAAELTVTGTVTPSALRVLVRGELDMSTTASLLHAMGTLLSSHASGPTTPVELDLGGVDFLDVCGLTALLQVRAMAEEVGRPFAVTRPRPFVRHLLRVTRLAGPLNVGAADVPG